MASVLTRGEVGDGHALGDGLCHVGSAQPVDAEQLLHGVLRVLLHGGGVGAGLRERVAVVEESGFGGAAGVAVGVAEGGASGEAEVHGRQRRRVVQSSLRRRGRLPTSPHRLWRLHRLHVQVLAVRRRRRLRVAVLLAGVQDVPRLEVLPLVPLRLRLLRGQVVLVAVRLGHVVVVEVLHGVGVVFLHQGRCICGTKVSMRPLRRPGEERACLTANVSDARYSQ